MARSRINPAIKTRLLVLGRWKELHAEQSRRIRARAANSAFYQVLMDLAPDVAKEFDIKGPEDSYRAYESAVALTSSRRVPMAADEEAGISPQDAKIRRDTDVKKIAGRTCSYVDAVEWAFVMSSFGEGAKTKDAPSEMAWALYLQFRESKNFMWDIAKSAITAKMKKEEVEENHGTAGFDGDSEYRVLEELGRVERGGESEGGAE